MFKKSLLVLGTAFAIAATVSLPASATGGGRDTSDPQEVPEPLTVIGSLVVGGGLVAKRLTGKKETEEA